MKKVAIIIVFFTASIATLVFIVGKTLLNNGITPALASIAILLISSLLIFFFGDKIILKIYGAKKIPKQYNPLLFEDIKRLATQASLNVPNLYVSDSTCLNAFSVGWDKNHASICVTKGMLNTLHDPELEGVLAHEISHIKNEDCLPAAFIAILLGFFLRPIFPLNALLFHVTISQKREYEADAFAALITRFPQGLALALEKISQDQTPLRFANAETAHLFIENPLRGSNSRWFSGLFNIHPPIEERIRLLRSM